MNIKGILRSTAAKLIAFACIVGCFAGALFLVENTITDFAANGLDQMVYRFEGDFADSSYMHQQLGIMCAEMANAFEDGMDAAEFSRQHTDFAGNYFGRMGDKTVGDDTLTEAAAKNSAFYMITRPGGNVQSNVGMYYGYPLAVTMRKRTVTATTPRRIRQRKAGSSISSIRTRLIPCCWCASRTHRLHPSRLSGNAENADYRRAPSGDCADVHCTGAVRVPAVRHRPQAGG